MLAGRQVEGKGKQLTETKDAGRYINVSIVIVFRVLASAADFFVKSTIKLLSLCASTAIFSAFAAARKANILPI